MGHGPAFVSYWFNRFGFNFFLICSQFQRLVILSFSLIIQYQKFRLFFYRCFFLSLEIKVVNSQIPSLFVLLSEQNKFVENKSPLSLLKLMTELNMIKMSSLFLLAIKPIDVSNFQKSQTWDATWWIFLWFSEYFRLRV